MYQTLKVNSKTSTITKAENHSQRVKRTSGSVFFFILLIASVAENALAQDRPGYQLFRQEEDWSFLRDAPEKDYLDPIKYIPLAGNGRTFITLGGELRSYFKFYNHEQLGAVDSPLWISAAAPDGPRDSYHTDRRRQNKGYVGTVPEITVIWNAGCHITSFLEVEYLISGPLLEDPGSS